MYANPVILGVRLPGYGIIHSLGLSKGCHHNVHEECYEKQKLPKYHTLLVLMYNCEFIFGRHQKSVKCFVKWKSIKLLFFLKNSQLDAAPLDVPVNI